MTRKNSDRLMFNHVECQAKLHLPQQQLLDKDITHKKNPGCNPELIGGEICCHIFWGKWHRPTQNTTRKLGVQVLNFWWSYVRFFMFLDKKKYNLCLASFRVCLKMTLKRLNIFDYCIANPRRFQICINSVHKLLVC